MKEMRKIIEIDEDLCDGCANCVVACEEGAIQIIDGKAKVIKEMFCDGLGACIGDCPQDALKIVEREADAFDEAAVAEHLKVLEKETKLEPAAPAGGCCSSKIQTFMPMGSCQQANRPVTTAAENSALTHWPIQINLVPPQAPFLKGADLLIVADCAPATTPNFHREFLKDKVMMMGCPKFDDGQAYVQKFAEIFRSAGLKSITVLIMEVPCCSGLPMMVKKGLELSGMNIPIEEVVISIRGGNVLQRIRN
ncbi:MAG: 4Fe-4S binding protein [bacterium]